jgi:hypothetical protein
MIFTLKTYKNIDEYNNHLIQNRIVKQKDTYILTVVKLFYTPKDVEMIEDLIELRYLYKDFSKRYSEYTYYLELLNKVEKSYYKYAKEMKSYW